MYNEIHEKSLKSMESVEPGFAGGGYIKIYPDRSEKEQVYHLIEELRKIDRLFVSDGYFYPIHEGGVSLEKKQAYANTFVTLLKEKGIVSRPVIKPYHYDPV